MALSVLVIGGGITGISTAEFLRREGVSVTVIDKVYPGDPQQASFGNAGLLASSAILYMPCIHSTIKQSVYSLWSSH